MKIYILVSFLLNHCLWLSEAAQEHVQCDGIRGFEGCACRMSDTKQVIGLHGILGNRSDITYPRFIAHDEKTEWWYAFQPCDNFDLFKGEKEPTSSGYQACIDSGAARFTNRSVDQCFGFGRQAHATFSFNKYFKYPVVSNLTLLYRNTTDLNKNGGLISLVCNWTVPANESIFQFIKVVDAVEDTWYFSLESRCCCPGGCPGNYITPTKPTNYVWWYVGVITIVSLVLTVIFARMHFRSQGETTLPVDREQEPLISDAASA